jgi:hypothetical protein
VLYHRPTHYLGVEAQPSDERKFGYEAQVKPGLQGWKFQTNAQQIPLWHLPLSTFLGLEPQPGLGDTTGNFGGQ